MFIEMFFVTECFMPLAEKLGVPVVGVSSLWSWKSTDYEMGNPCNPATVPYEMSSFTEDFSSFRSRLTSVWNYVSALWFHYSCDASVLEKFYQHHYPNSPLLRKNKVSLLFLRSHSSFFPRPLAPNVVEIGGIDIKPAKALPENIKAFIEESKHGVILFTLGSAVRGSDISPETTKVIVDAFSEIPQRVIWKFEEKIDDLPKNVLISNWIPQRDILAHENVIAFMSHCGMSGMFQAIDTATPMILMPVFGDQPTNAAILKKLGGGVYLDIFSITKTKLLAALNEVINNTRYRENMRDLSQKFRDRPMTPQQSVVYWTEYVTRHNGASHLRTVAADMPLYQYLLLDVVAFVGIIATTVTLGFYYIIKKVCILLFVSSKIKGSPKLKKKNL